MASLVIGTRGSALALWQAEHVAASLRQQHPDLDVELNIIRSEGDARTDVPIAGVGTTGIFVRRLEQALRDEACDIAVHSLKDMPTDQPGGLTIAAVLERHDPRDALLTVDGLSLDDLPRGASVGTGSMRRRAQLLHHRPDLEIVSIRGNVDTRIRKLQEGKVDAIVLAMAGVQRLGLDSVPMRSLEPAICLPAAGQGAIAIELRQADGAATKRVRVLNDPPTEARVTAERAFLRRLGGGCQAPATAYARIEGNGIHVEALVGDPDGRALLMERETGPIDDAARIGARLAERLLVAGAEAVLARAREHPAQHDEPI